MTALCVGITRRLPGLLGRASRGRRWALRLCQLVIRRAQVYACLTQTPKRFGGEDGTLHARRRAQSTTSLETSP